MGVVSLRLSNPSKMLKVSYRLRRKKGGFSRSFKESNRQSGSSLAPRRSNGEAGIQGAAYLQFIAEGQRRDWLIKFGINGLNQNFEFTATI